MPTPTLPSSRMFTVLCTATTLSAHDHPSSTDLPSTGALVTTATLSRTPGRLQEAAGEWGVAPTLHPGEARVWRLTVGLWNLED